MFGTDNGMDEAMYRNHFPLAGDWGRIVRSWGYPGQGRWEIYGLDLPDPVLEKIYHLNAERVFEQFKGRSKDHPRERNNETGIQQKIVVRHYASRQNVVLVRVRCSFTERKLQPSTGENGHSGAEPSRSKWM